MKNKRILAVVAIVLIIIAVMIALLNVKAGNEAKYLGSYTIEDIISKYNVVTFGDVSAGHIVGPVAVKGDITSPLYHSQQTQGVSSFIIGNPGTGNVDCQDGLYPTLYLGLQNESNVSGSIEAGFSVNGSWYTRNPIEFTDSYIDFSKLYSSIQSQQTKLYQGTVVTPDENGVIHIQGGKAYVIESLANVTQIVLDDFELFQSAETVITIKQSGTMTFPTIINGETNQTYTATDYKKSGSTYAGINLVWSLPNATNITFPQQISVGHIVAPNADVVLPTTHYNGCYIVKNLIGNPYSTELHYYPYNGGSLASVAAASGSTDSGEEDPDDSTSGSTGSGEEDPDDSSSGNAGSGTGTSGDGTSGSTGSGEEDPDDSSSGNTGSGTGTSGDGTSGSTGSGEEDPDDSSSGNTGSGTGTSGDSTSGSASSGTGTSGDSTSGSASSGTGTSGDNTSGSASSGTGTSGDSTSGSASSGTGTSGDSTSGSIGSGTGTSGDSTSGSASSGTAGSGSSTSGSTSSGTGTSGSSASGSTSSGTGTSGDSTSGSASSGTGTSGDSTSGSASSGTGTSGSSASGSTSLGTGTSGDSTSGSASTGTGTSGSSTSGSTSSGTGTSGDSTSGSASSGTGTSGDSTSGSASSGTGNSGSSASGSTSLGTAASGSSTSGTENSEKKSESIQTGDVVTISIASCIIAMAVIGAMCVIKKIKNKNQE